MWYVNDIYILYNAASLYVAKYLLHKGSRSIELVCMLTIQVRANIWPTWNLLQELVLSLYSHKPTVGANHNFQQSPCHSLAHYLTHDIMGLFELRLSQYLRMTSVLWRGGTYTFICLVYWRTSRRKGNNCQCVYTSSLSSDMSRRPLQLGLPNSNLHRHR